MFSFQAALESFRRLRSGAREVTTWQPSGPDTYPVPAMRDRWFQLFVFRVHVEQGFGR